METDDEDGGMKQENTGKNVIPLPEREGATGLE